MCRCICILFAFAVLPIAAVAGISEGPYSDLGQGISLSKSTPSAIVTDGISELTPTSVRMHGTVTPEGLGFEIFAWFRYGLGVTLTTNTGSISLGTDIFPVPYSIVVSGLTPNTQYSFRAEASDGGATQGNTLQFTTPAAPFTRDSAIARVITQVINPSPYNSTLIAFIYDPPGPDTTLPAGTEIAPLDSSFVQTLSGERWFFWIDLTGDIRFAHPCKFVMVDPSNGDVQTLDGEWWPAITTPTDPTVYPWESIDDRFSDDANRIFGDYLGDPEPGIEPVTVPSPGSGFRLHVPDAHAGVPLMEGIDGIARWRSGMFLEGNTCAILVGGGALKKGEENAWQGDLDSMNTAMTTPGPGATDPIADEVQIKNKATKDDIQKMIDSAAAHGCNSIIFYYSGHGSKRGGGSLVLADGRLSYADLATMLNIPGLKFKDVILDNCYGGTCLDDFGGKTSAVSLTTAADSTKTAVGGIRYTDVNSNNVLDNSDSIVSGSGKFTRAWMACWRKLRDSLNRNPTRKEIFDWVRHVNPDSINQKQNPQYKAIIPPITFVLNINSPGIYNFTGTGVVIDFQNIGGLTQATVTRFFDPAPGQIDPIETELIGMSISGYWQITLNPPVSVQANVGFQYDATSEAIPFDALTLVRRPEPTIPNPDPFWNEWPNVDPFSPTLVVALGVNGFSQWAFAQLGNQVSIEVGYNANWNLISMPVNPPDPAVAVLFPTATSSAFSYDDGYSAESSVDGCTGYWLKFGAPIDVMLSGTEVVSSSCPIKEGWNLISSISTPILTSDITTTPPLTLSPYYAYDNGYLTVTTLEPGKGYWLKSSGDGTLIMDPPSTVHGNVRTTHEDLTTGLSSLKLTDAAGNSQTLWFGSAGPGPNRSQELPPQPPGGVFDARFASGRGIETVPAAATIDGAQLPLRVTGAVYPVTLEWKIDALEQAEVSIAGIGTITGSGRYTMQAEEPVVIGLKGGAILAPTVYALYQNYPDPFNPGTTIGYDLAVAGQVKLVVYDVLGREVKTLVDEMQEAGARTVHFDASALPSGVYIYRLQSGSFNAVKKMVLMK